MIVRTVLLACALCAGCATTAPAERPAPPARAAAPASTPASEPSAAEPALAASSAPTPLEIAQPLGMVRLTGDVQALREGKPVRFVVRGASAAARTRLAVAHPEAEADGDAIKIGPGALPREVLERHRAASFLVDFDQAEVLELARAIPASASLAELRKHVAGLFERIQYGTFWTASRTVRNRAGDCTEHAVLLAAVARAHHRPARVVLGYALVADKQASYAFGHAWTEIHDGTSWQRIDATPVGEMGATYLILSELDDEGPSYAMSSTTMATVILQTSLAVERSPQ